MAAKRLRVRDKKHKIIILFIIVFVIVGALWLFFSASEKDADITKPTIAVIPVYGTITMYGSDGGLMGGKSGGIKDTIDLIDKAEKDPNVKAIIFEINSPGGSVVASEELANKVKSMKKPTVALLREVAASGGYWVASASDKIVADPATITGSIGVIGSYLQFSKLMENYGITYERLVSGPYKDSGSPYKELTSAERQKMQSKIDTINNFFINSISKNRNLDEEYVKNLATGEIFLGIEAYNLKLVDVLGGEKEAQKTAEQLAGISNSKLVRFEKKISFWELVSAKSQNSAYWVGRGIGDAWNIFTQKDDYSIKAEI